MQTMTHPMPSYGNLLDMFVSLASQHGDKPLLWAADDNGIYESLSWRDVAVKANALAQSLRSMGIKAGDKVVLVSENRPEWLISDLAIMATGAITVPAYCTNTTDDHRHVIEHSEASCVIVSTKTLADIVSPIAAAAELCNSLVSMDDLGASPSGDLEHHNWFSLVEPGGDPTDVIEQASRTLGQNDTACFIYTSGTGGRPKAVMQSHGNLLANLAGAWHLMAPFGLKDEVFLSFLPLSHSFEHTLGQFFPLAIGGQIYYGQGVEQLAANIEQSRPTMMACVPRLFEAMSQRITRTVERHGGLKAKLFHLTQRLGRKKFCGRLGPIDSLLDVLVEIVVRQKFRARFGMRLKVMVSAGAALDPDIALFFIAMGIPILQGYGQTEAGPMISGNPITKNKPATIGPPIDGVDVRIAADGEILVRGDNVMQGYWKDAESTASTIREGWLHTGDIGTLDHDGYLTLTDRKKDIIVLAGGDNVSPARLEGLLVQQDDIAQAMVFGDEFSALSALIVPEDDLLKRIKFSRGDIQDRDDPELKKALSSAVDRVNGQVQAIEKIRQFFVITEPFTIENTQLTPTLKIRRHVIKAVYADLL